MEGEGKGDLLCRELVGLCMKICKCDEVMRFVRVLGVEECNLDLQCRTCSYGDMVGRF